MPVDKLTKWVRERHATAKSEQLDHGYTQIEIMEVITSIVKEDQSLLYLSLIEEHKLLQLSNSKLKKWAVENTPEGMVVNEFRSTLLDIAKGLKQKSDAGRIQTLKQMVADENQALVSKPGQMCCRLFRFV